METQTSRQTQGLAGEEARGQAGLLPQFGASYRSPSWAHQTLGDPRTRKQNAMYGKRERYRASKLAYGQAPGALGSLMDAKMTLSLFPPLKQRGISPRYNQQLRQTVMHDKERLA